MNINPESGDYGRIRKLPVGASPSLDEIELQVEEANRLRYIRRTEREVALAELRAANPVRFHYQHKRNHR